jgi:ABC-2 type transport system ATP-binding protein
MYINVTNEGINVGGKSSIHTYIHTYIYIYIFIYILIGMNGGGKSSLFKVLALAENIPVDGTIRIAGKDSIKQQWLIATQEDMGYVSQEGGLFDFLTVKESYEFFYGLHTIQKEEKDVIDSSNLFSCRGNSEEGGAPVEQFPGRSPESIIPLKYLNYLVRALSGGNKKKLSVAVSNINNPSFLAIDECTSGDFFVY